MPWWVRWCEEGDHLLASGGGFRRLMQASDLPTRTIWRAGVFLLYRAYLWNKQQVNKSYYVIHHAVPHGGGSRYFLRITLSSPVWNRNSVIIITIEEYGVEMIFCNSITTMVWIQMRSMTLLNVIKMSSKYHITICLFFNAIFMEWNGLSFILGKQIIEIVMWYLTQIYMVEEQPVLAMFFHFTQRLLIET